MGFPSPCTLRLRSGDAPAVIAKASLSLARCCLAAYILVYFYCLRRVICLHLHKMRRTSLVAWVCCVGSLRAADLVDDLERSPRRGVLPVLGQECLRGCQKLCATADRQQLCHLESGPDRAPVPVQVQVSPSGDGAARHRSARSGGTPRSGRFRNPRRRWLDRTAAPRPPVKTEAMDNGRLFCLKGLKWSGIRLKFSASQTLFSSSTFMIDTKSFRVSSQYEIDSDLSEPMQHDVSVTLLGNLSVTRFGPGPARYASCFDTTAGRVARSGTRR